MEVEAVTGSLANVRRLVQRVCRRQSVSRALTRLATGCLFWAALYLLAVLVSRLTGLLPDVFTPITVLAVPCLALTFSLLFHRGTSMEDGARLTDQHGSTDDLFLTSLRLSPDSGAFRPLVVTQAEEAAEKISAAWVVPWVWQSRYAYAMGSVLVLLLVGAFTPQLDPFEKREAATRTKKRAEKLEKTRQATAVQAQALERKNVEARHEAVERELKLLEETFRAAKPANKEATRKKLADSQKQIGEMWRQLSEEKIRDALSQAKTAQQFGAQSPVRKKFREMAREGKFSDLKKEMEDIKRALEELAKSPDSGDRRKKMEELKEKMQAMADALSEQISSTGLNEALSRALEQMDMANMEGLAEKAMQAMGESMKLSQQELEQLAKAMGDMKALEEGLTAAQMARALNEMGELNGEGAGDGKGMSDYEKLYREMMANGGEGNGAGGGMGGPGQGHGGKAPENPDAVTDYKSEQSKTALQKGRLLMNMQSKGNAEKGELKEAYRAAAGAIKDAASEAILKEQVPPGYHDSIRDYFDNLEPES